MGSKEDMIEKVRALWRLADHPNTGEHEKSNAIAQAQKLMAKYQIDEIVLHEKSGQREDVVMLDIRVDEDGRPAPVKDQRIALVNVLALNNRCKGVITSREESVHPDTGKVIRGGTFFVCIGYRSDAEFVKQFYGNIALDMMMAMMDEPSKTKNYQAEFATGFVDRIDQRMRAIRRVVEDEVKATTGMELVLVTKEKAIASFVDQQFPNLRKYTTNARAKYDPNARARGARAADRSDVGQGKVDTGRKGELNR